MYDNQQAEVKKLNRVAKKWGTGDGNLCYIQSLYIKVKRSSYII